ncbi:hypothetical protein J2W21_003011 [Sinomonas atrocyanea]|uniref:Ltp family lipoprotein n=1 Tax=Sinomonas atrocyanea TaxID=37927 RepID=UPI002788E72B|nr:Ltp family lipoprotein [Sinomonas atrocyanea]MDP9885488.1 hypothetical protein [Sinomonas atrocyanea]
MSTENQHPGSDEARVRKATRPFWKKKRFIIPAAIVALFVVAGIAGGGNKTETPAAVRSATAAPGVTTADASSPSPTPVPVKTTQAPPPAPPKPAVPAEYIAALASAESYSENMHMSKARIYDQLTSQYGEKFSAKAGQYAVDNLKADYKANALETAKTYQQQMNMSPARIYDQLTSAYGEKFTAAEAQYAVDNLGK